jgi:hypothetical protein
MIREREVKTIGIRYSRERECFILSWQSPTMSAPAFEEFPSRYEAAQHALAMLFFGTSPKDWRVECLTAPRFQ